MESDEQELGDRDVRKFTRCPVQRVPITYARGTAPDQIREVQERKLRPGLQKRYYGRLQISERQSARVRHVKKSPTIQLTHAKVLDKVNAR